MSLKKLVILGSTGSIGKSTMDVIDNHPGSFLIRGLATFSNIELLKNQYEKYKPEYLVVVDPLKGKALKAQLSNEKVEVLIGEDELIKLTSITDLDIVVNAVVGAAGLKASLETVKLGRNLALANKESLVTGGSLFASICQKTNAKILPIDSEHSAIWQALLAGKENEVKSIILTSSGGPFRNLPFEEFNNITVEQALNHPTWNMGRKITIDSATLANKGLEVIEAVAIFSMPVDKIKVVIHPQSIIHSMVEYCDSSVIAQLSKPDMRLPISYALFWPERIESDYGQLDWNESLNLNFEPPDLKRFPALRLAFEVAERQGTAPAIYNAANEMAVDAFLDEKIHFVDIPDIIHNTLEAVETIDDPSLEDILQADTDARTNATKMMEKLTC